MHTSTVTVAVLDPDSGSNFRLDHSEVEIRTTRGDKIRTYRQQDNKVTDHRSGHT